MAPRARDVRHHKVGLRCRARRSTWLNWDIPAKSLTRLWVSLARAGSSDSQLRSCLTVFRLAFPRDLPAIKDLPDFERQFRLCDRLLQQIDAIVEPALMNNGVSRIASHVENFEPEAYLCRAPSEFAPIDSGHHDIRQQEIDLWSIL